MSKIARFSGPDVSDIAEIIRTFGIAANTIQARAEQALQGYVGNTDYLRMNLRDVLKLALRLTGDEDMEPEQTPSN